MLTITRAGRLAILELKASEQLHLPIQAGLWLRVRRHLELGDFRCYGYFPGVEIQRAPPLVYLVAPALSFHPATGNLLRHLSYEIEDVSRRDHRKLAPRHPRRRPPIISSPLHESREQKLCAVV